MDVDFIIAFESGEVSNKEIVKNFAEGIESGLVWNLQGSYGRAAQGLIDHGLITIDGEVDTDVYEELTGEAYND